MCYYPFSSNPTVRYRSYVACLIKARKGFNKDTQRQIFLAFSLVVVWLRLMPLVFVSYRPSCCCCYLGGGLYSIELYQWYSSRLLIWITEQNFGAGWCHREGQRQGRGAMDSASDIGSGGCGFESRLALFCPKDGGACWGEAVYSERQKLGYGGDVAHMEERALRMREARGSIPCFSKMFVFFFRFCKFVCCCQNREGCKKKVQSVGDRTPFSFFVFFVWLS